MNKILLTCFLIITGFTTLQAQQAEMFPTPTAASIGKFGEIPVSLYNGLPNIEIPLYTLKSNNLSVPVSLNYHAGGVRPNEHGSWVGVNWSLFAGGVINRIKNDRNDDFKRPTGETNAKGFYYCYTDGSNINWNDPNAVKDAIYYYNQFLPEQLNAINDMAPDEFSFNFLGMSGSFMLGRDGKWKLKCKQQGLTFNVEVVTGSYVFKYPNAAGGTVSTEMFHIFQKFILTGPDGTRYEFGGFAADDFGNDKINAIEFERVAVFDLSGQIDVQGQLGKNTYASAWYLTKIISPEGNEINFEYERKGYHIIATSSSYGFYYHGENTQHVPFINQIFHYSGIASSIIFPVDPLQANTSTYGFLKPQFRLQDPVYLKKITSSQGSITFESSRSYEQDYSAGAWRFGSCNNYYDPLLVLWQMHSYCMGLNGDEHFACALPNGVGAASFSGAPYSRWFKLDKIIVKNQNDEQIKEFDFSYLHNSTSRLFLTGLKEKAGTKELPAYEFEYNGTDLPDYLTNKTDHWGFYNGISALEGGSSPLVENNFPSSAFMTEYEQKRAPNATLMLKGSLKKITYPTGGTTEFIFEPHSYSKNVNTQSSPFSIITRSSDQIAGGLRIKQIISKGFENTPDLSKTYYYVEDYLTYLQTGQSLSSGILSSPEPKYLEDGNMSLSNGGTLVNYKIWSSNNILPSHTTSGNHITYTKVTEVSQDGGFKISTYSNHDNGYIDKEASYINYIASYDYWLRDASSADIERGLLLSEKTYRNDTRLLQEVQYEYNDDPNRFNPDGTEHVRYYRSKPKTFTTEGVTFKFVNTALLVFYTHYPYLKKVKTTVYNQTGANNFLQTNTTYQYNSVRLPSQVNNSLENGKELISQYKYTSDYLNTHLINCSNYLDDCINNCEISYPNYSTNQQDAENLVICRQGCQDYYANCKVQSLADTYADAIIKMQDKRMFALVEEQTILKEGQTNRLIGGKINFYKNFSPGGYHLEKVHKINLTQPTTNYTLSTINASEAFVYDSHYDTSPEVLFNAYDNTGNMLQTTNKENMPTSFLWAYNKQYAVAEIKNASYATATTALSQIGLTESTLNALTDESVLRTKLEELRNHNLMKNAMISYYTYKPQVGITSATDANGVRVYYSYDEFNRLKWIKDHNGYILKTYDYIFMTR